MNVAIRPPTCSLPVIFLGNLKETCILCFSRRFCSHVNCECVMSRGLIPSFHQNLPSRMWFSPRPQSKPRSHSGNGRAGGCEPYASAFLTSYCILHSPSLRPSVKSRPAGFARSIRLHVDRKFGGVTAAAGSGVFPRGTACHGGAWQSMADRPSAVRHMAPFTQIPNTGESGKSRGVAFILVRADMTFLASLWHLTKLG